MHFHCVCGRQFPSTLAIRRHHAICPEAKKAALKGSTTPHTHDEENIGDIPHTQVQENDGATLQTQGQEDDSATFHTQDQESDDATPHIQDQENDGAGEPLQRTARGASAAANLPVLQLQLPQQQDEPFQPQDNEENEQQEDEQQEDPQQQAQQNEAGGSHEGQRQDHYQRQPRLSGPMLALVGDVLEDFVVESLYEMLNAQDFRKNLRKHIDDAIDRQAHSHRRPAPTPLDISRSKRARQT